jgi:hypothetical protein
MNTDDYLAFLGQKRATVTPAGFEVSDSQINSMLFPHQKAITRWTIGQGRDAVFANVGLGKTAIQLEYARLIMEHTGLPALILVPLGRRAADDPRRAKVRD